MYADPYWCGVCDVTFNSEKASYEHDVSLEHHEQYEKTQKASGRPTLHYCSICDRGGISSMTSWSSHCNGKQHKKAMEKFREFYKMHHERSRSSKERFESKPSSLSKKVKSVNEKPKLSPMAGNKGKIQNDGDSKRSIFKQNDSPFGLSSKMRETEPVQPDKFPDTASSTMSDSVSKHSGMMLNILETIDPHPPPPVIPNISNLERYRRKPKDSRCQQSTLRNKRKANQTHVEPGPKRTAHSSPHIVSSSTSVPSIDQSNSSPRIDQQVETGTVGDLKRMQEALAISQDLESLTSKQSALEAQLSEIQIRLDEVKAKRRELKLRRATLLRGLVHSESDEDNENIVSSASNPAQLNQTSRAKSFGMPENPIPTAPTAPLNSSRLMPSSPLNQPSQHWPNTGPPPIVSSGIQQSHEPFTSSNPLFRNVVSSGFVTQPSSSFLQTGQMDHSVIPGEQVRNPSVTHLPTFTAHTAPTLPNNSLPVTTAPNTASVSFTAPAQPNNSLPVVTAPNASSVLLIATTQPNNSVSVITAPNASSVSSPLVASTSVPQSASPTATGAGRVDLERLALIRQALQSPDSWQFTFEDVDRMLQQAAAKANTKQPTQANTHIPQNTIERTASVPEPIAASAPSANLPDVSRNYVYKPTINVKGEPDIHAGQMPPVSHISTGDPPMASPSKSCDVLKPSSDSSSSFDSSEDDRASHPHSVPKIKRLIKRDPSSKMDSPNPPTPSSIQPVVTSGLKELVKYGEFHAFDGKTAAVIDMLVHYSSWSLFIGGQNGAVGQFDLKTHACIRRMVPRDASVTQMVLDPSERSLFVGYYDNYFAEFSIATGSLVFEKYLAQRIEALAVPPVRDMSFLYLGLSNGDILRHDINTRAVNVLYDRSLDCIDQGPDVKSSVGISSLAVVQSGTRLLLIVGDQERSLTIRAASDGSAVLCIRSAPHKGPPQGIAKLPVGTLFCAYSERAVRIHNWKTGTGVMTLQTQKVTSSCVTERYLALGDSEGAIRVHKLQHNGLPQSRPMKVYFAATRAAITSLIGYGEALIAGGLDGSVTAIWVNEPAKNHVCLYGPFGHNCGIGFESREDLIKHVLDTHFIFGSNKSIMCRWGAGRCRVRFSDTKSIKAISDHLLTHMPD